STIGRRDLDIPAEAVGQNNRHRAGIEAVVADAVTPAQHGPVAEAIRETDARAEVVRVKVVRVLANAVHSGESDHARHAGDGIYFVRIEAALVVVGLPARRVHIPAKTEVQRQTRRDLPIVLNERAPIIGPGSYTVRY